MRTHQPHALSRVSGVVRTWTGDNTAAENRSPRNIGRGLAGAVGSPNYAGIGTIQAIAAITIVRAWFLVCFRTRSRAAARRRRSLICRLSSLLVVHTSSVVGRRSSVGRLFPVGQPSRAVWLTEPWERADGGGFGVLHVTLRVYHPLFSPLFTLHFVILSVSRLNRFTRPAAPRLALVNPTLPFLLFLSRDWPLLRAYFLPRY